MILRADRRGRALLVGVIVAISVAALVAACDAVASPSASPRQTTEPVVAPPPPGAAQVVACLSINPAECALIARVVQAALPAERGSPFSMLVRLDRCADGAATCPESLVARRGSVVVEYADEGPPFEYRVAGTPAQPSVEVVEQGSGIWTDPIQPGSPPVEGDGPFEYEVGHCGLLHAVDFDGSFWVLVGDVPGDHQALAGAELGAIRLVNHDRVEYLGTDDARIGLARFPGAKVFLPCR